MAVLSLQRNKQFVLGGVITELMSLLVDIIKGEYLSALTGIDDIDLVDL